jgi:hypothetical protein
MHQRALTPARRTWLSCCHPLGPRQSQSFGRNLSHRPAQPMSSRFNGREAHILLQELSDRNLKSFGNAYKRLPFLFTDLCTGHLVHP